VKRIISIVGGRMLLSGIAEECEGWRITCKVGIIDDQWVVSLEGIGQWGVKEGTKEGGKENGGKDEREKEKKNSKQGERKGGLSKLRIG
jgi:hypothetical protein